MGTTYEGSLWHTKSRSLWHWSLTYIIQKLVGVHLLLVWLRFWYFSCFHMSVFTAIKDHSFLESFPNLIYRYMYLIWCGQCWKWVALTFILTSDLLWPKTCQLHISCTTWHRPAFLAHLDVRSTGVQEVADLVPARSSNIPSWTLIKK